MTTNSPTTDSRAERDERRRRGPLGNRLWLCLGAIALAMGLITVLITGYMLGANGSSADPLAGVLYAASGIGLLVPTMLLWLRLSPPERQTAFPIHCPDRAELGLTLLFVPLGVAASTVAVQLVGSVGLEFEPFAYDLTDPVTAAGVLFGPILVAPFAEEVLFRSALIESLRGRDWSTLAAGCASVGLFAGFHLFALGAAGVVAMAAWAVFPTVLYLRYENVTGPWLLHLLNNLYAYVVAVGGLSLLVS